MSVELVTSSVLAEQEKQECCVSGSCIPDPEVVSASSGSVPVLVPLALSKSALMQTDEAKQRKRKKKRKVILIDDDERDSKITGLGEALGEAREIEVEVEETPELTEKEKEKLDWRQIEDRKEKIAFEKKLTPFASFKIRKFVRQFFNYLQELYPHPRDKRIRLFDLIHCYEIDGKSWIFDMDGTTPLSIPEVYNLETGKQIRRKGPRSLVSVSGFVHSFFPDAGSLPYLLGTKYGQKRRNPQLKHEYFGKSLGDILKMWRSNSTARDQGTHMHHELEVYINLYSKNAHVANMFLLGPYYAMQPSSSSSVSSSSVSPSSISPPTSPSHIPSSSIASYFPVETEKEKLEKKTKTTWGGRTLATDTSGFVWQTTKPKTKIPEQNINKQKEIKEKEEQKEKEVNNDLNIPRSFLGIPACGQKELEQAKIWWDNFRVHHRPCRTELQLFDEDLALCGTIDALFFQRTEPLPKFKLSSNEEEEKVSLSNVKTRDGDMLGDDPFVELVMIDYKRSNKIVPTPQKAPERDPFWYGIGPCSNQPNSNQCHYNLALNVYKWLAEKHFQVKIENKYYKIKVVVMSLLALHPEFPTYKLDFVPDLSSVVDGMLKVRKQCLQENKFVAQDLPDVFEEFWPGTCPWPMNKPENALFNVEDSAKNSPSDIWGMHKRYEAILRDLEKVKQGEVIVSVSTSTSVGLTSKEETAKAPTQE